VLGEHARRVCREVREQRVLHPGQCDRRAAEADVAGGVVDPQCADPRDPPALARPAAAQDGADAGAQLRVGARLCDDVV
jgi:hypothetical protein